MDHFTSEFRNKIYSSQILNWFEELFREHDYIPNALPSREDEKREAPYKAIASGIPEVRIANFMCKHRRENT